MKFLEKHCAQCQAYKERDHTAAYEDDDDDNNHEAADCLVAKKISGAEEGGRVKKIEYKGKCC